MSKRTTDLVSRRADGRGHWKKGNLRNDPTPISCRAVAKLSRLIRKGYSYRDIAKTLKSDSKTVWRWVNERFPTDEVATVILATTVWIPPEE